MGVEEGVEMGIEIGVEKGRREVLQQAQQSTHKFIYYLLNNTDFDIARIARIVNVSEAFVANARKSPH